MWRSLCLGTCQTGARPHSSSKFISWRHLAALASLGAAGTGVHHYVWSLSPVENSFHCLCPEWQILTKRVTSESHLSHWYIIQCKARELRPRNSSLKPSCHKGSWNSSGSGLLKAMPKGHKVWSFLPCWKAFKSGPGTSEVHGRTQVPKANCRWVTGGGTFHCQQNLKTSNQLQRAYDRYWGREYQHQENHEFLKQWMGIQIFSYVYFSRLLFPQDFSLAFSFMTSSRLPKEAGEEEIWKETSIYDMSNLGQWAL